MGGDAQDTDMPTESQAGIEASSPDASSPDAWTHVPRDTLWEGFPGSPHTGFMNKIRGCTTEPLIIAALLFVALFLIYLV